jgi:hypothetical protein
MALAPNPTQNNAAYCSKVFHVCASRVCRALLQFAVRALLVNLAGQQLVDNGPAQVAVGAATAQPAHKSKKFIQRQDTHFVLKRTVTPPFKQKEA